MYSVDEALVMPDAVCDVDGTHRWQSHEYDELAALVGAGGPVRCTVAEFVEAVRARGRVGSPERSETAF